MNDDKDIFDAYDNAEKDYAKGERAALPPILTAKKMNHMVNFRMPWAIYEEYKIMCEEYSFTPSKRIRKFIERELEGWRKSKLEKIKKIEEERKKNDGDKK